MAKWFVHCLFGVLICSINPSLSVPRAPRVVVPHRVLSPFSIHRGGSVPKSSPSKIPKHSDVEWMLRQLCLRQQRAQLLSSALTEAGFTVPQLVDRSQKLKKVTKAWECAIAPDGEGEQFTGCLIMGEVLPGSKCVAPAGSGKWVTLWELNKMRRTEPAKVSGLWYDQFNIDCNVFSQHAGPLGQILNFVLDTKTGLRLLFGAVFSLATVILRQPLWYLLLKFCTSSFLWNQYHNWSRIIYAPLAAKLYLVTFLFGSVLNKAFSDMETKVRDRIVEWECDLIELVTPVSTVLEKKDVTEEKGTQGNKSI